MYRIDYHIHTKFSYDAKAEPLDEIKVEMERGIDDFIFTDHCECNGTLAVPKGMKPWSVIDVDAYYKCMSELRSSSPKDFGIGIELGQATQGLDVAADFVKCYPWDFIISSLHNIRGECDFGYIKYSERDIDDLFRRYFSELYETAALDNFSVLGHLYYPIRYVLKQGIDYDISKFDKEISDILALLVKNGRGIEINFKGYIPGKHDFVPSLKYAKMFKALGGETVTVGSDAHVADACGKYVDDALEMLTEAGFKYIAKFRQLKPEYIKIK